jgi:HKD family nuclease
VAEYSSTKINTFTGGDEKEKQLYPHLIESMRHALSIDIIVSFVMESGVRLLISELEEAVKRNVPIRILTGNYLGITQPSALYLLAQKLSGKADLRFYNEPERSFHPKAYFFHSKSGSEVYIGSSNLSLSGLTSGMEWNYRLEEAADPAGYVSFYQTFTDLFENHSIVLDRKALA